MTDRDSGSDDAVKDLLVELDPEGRRIFVALERMMAEPLRNLRWYYRLGRCVGELRGREERFQYGAAWIRRVGAALKVSRDHLAKALAFATRFPDEKDLDELEQLNTPWTAVVSSLVLGDRVAQLAMLRQASREKWSVSRLRLEVGGQLGDRRRHRTGRRHRTPVADEPEFELADLVRRCVALSHYVEIKWLDGDAALLPCLQRMPKRRKSGTIRGSLTQAEESLRILAANVQRLRKGLGEVGGNGSRSPE